MPDCRVLNFDGNRDDVKTRGSIHSGSQRLEIPKMAEFDHPLNCRVNFGIMRSDKQRRAHPEPLGKNAQMRDGKVSLTTENFGSQSAVGSKQPGKVRRCHSIFFEKIFEIFQGNPRARFERCLLRTLVASDKTIHEKRFRTRMRIRPSFNRFRLNNTHGDILSSTATQVTSKRHHKSYRAHARKLQKGNMWRLRREYAPAEWGGYNERRRDRHALRL